MEASCATFSKQLEHLSAVNDELLAEKNALQAQVEKLLGAAGGCRPGTVGWHQGAPPTACPELPPHRTSNPQVQDLQAQAESAAVVLESSRAQLEALRGEKAALALQGQELAAELEGSRAQLQALARQNGELRWGGVGWGGQ